MALAPVMSLLPPPDLALVGTFKFPVHNAQCQRIRTVAKLFELVGTRVRIGAANPTPDCLPQRAEDRERPVFHLSENPAADDSVPSKLRRHLLGGGRTIDWLQKSSPRDSAVSFYGISASFAWQLVRYCRGVHVPLILDVVEWYQPSHVLGGALGPFRWDTELAVRVVFPKARNIMVISRYLQRHFEAKGCRTLYLPAILDVLSMTPDLAPRPGGRHLSIAYTGTPWKKDLLDPMFEAILRLDPNGSRIRFTLAGPSHGDLLKLPALKKRGLTELPPGIVTLGYVSHDEATATIRGADFSVLLRHRDQRYALAGFPTKVPESLAMGTPLIGNMSSDLGDFLKDAQQAIVCDQPTPEACQRALERALAMNPDQLAHMRRASRALAERVFDFRQYVEPMRAFMSGLELP